MIRLVARKEDFKRDLMKLARERLWRLRTVLLPRAPDDNHEMHWQPGPDGTEVRHVVDPIVRFAYIVIDGPGESALRDEVTTRIPCYAPVELLDRLAAAPDAARARCALELGVGAPSSFDQAVFEAITATMGDPDPGVRRAALWAAAYAPWAAYRPVAQALAATDPSEVVRSTAEMLRDALDMRARSEVGLATGD